MSYWSENPELYNEIIFNNLVRHGMAKEKDRDDPDRMYELVLNAPLEIVLEAEREYWADRIDEAKEKGQNL